MAAAAARLLFSKTDASSKGFPLSWVKGPTLSHSGLVEHPLPAVSAAPLAHPWGIQPKPLWAGRSRGFPSAELCELSAVTSWAASVCARCPCPLGAVLPLPAQSEAAHQAKAAWKHLVCARCVLSMCPLSQPLLLCQPINLQSARTPWFPGHCCWLMCSQVINDTIDFSWDSLLFLLQHESSSLALACPGTALRCHLSWHQLETLCALQSPHCHQCSLSISAGTDTGGHLHLCSLTQSPSTPL